MVSLTVWRLLMDILFAALVIAFITWVSKKRRRRCNDVLAEESKPKPKGGEIGWW